MIFNELISTLTDVGQELSVQSIRAVNSALTLRNWVFGFYIFEFEQNGKDRAEYGSSLLANIAREMMPLKIPNTNMYELARCRQFYLSYPLAGKLIAASQPIFGTSQKLISSNLFGTSQISPTPSVNENLNDDTTPGVLNIPGSHYIDLFAQIAYSHFVELIKITDPLKRLFYELECVKGAWSVRELKRNIGSLLFERTGLSTNKEKLIDSVHQKSEAFSLPDIIRDPYIFEFLGLKPQEVLPEKDLEQALLNHFTEFLMELGKGFCLEARQKRILIDNEHYYIDLVFYHRLLHCHILVDLKTESFHYSHAGQLNMYVEYYKKYEMPAGDNPPVGILLCTDKDHEHVAFATAGMDDKIFVSKYLVALPQKNELEVFIKNELKNRLTK